MAGGQGFTSTAGSIASLAVTVALSGIAITSAQGAISANNDGTVALVGASSSVSAGTINIGWGQGLSGAESASNHGSLTLTLRPTDLVGQEITSAAGTVTAVGSGSSAHLSGQEITSEAGNVDGGAQVISGLGATFAQTAPSVVIELPISGIESACGIGVVVPQQEAVDSLIESGIGNALPAMSIAITGSGMTGFQGAVSITGDASLSLTGIESTVSAGSVGIEESYPISGESITSAQYNVGAPGGATLTGSAVSVIAGSVFTDNDRTYAITGQSITAQDGITFASSLAFAIGQQLDSSLQGIGPREATLSGISISVDQGAVSIPVVESVSTVTGGWPVPPRKKRRYEKPKQDEIDPAKARELAEAQEKQEYLKRQEEHSKEVTRQIKELLDKQDLVNEYLRIEKEKDAEKEEEALLMLIAMSR